MTDLIVDALMAINAAIVYNDSVSDVGSYSSPVVSDVGIDSSDDGAHPPNGECLVCCLQLGRGRKKCPDVRCGHITKGANADACKFCGHQFIVREQTVKKRKRISTADVGVQCNLPGRGGLYD